MTSPNALAWADLYPTYGAVWTPNVPKHTIRWYQTNEECTDPVEGDLLLIRHTGLLPTLIRTGERVMALSDHGLEPYCWTNHAAIVTYRNGVPMVSEMAGRGNQIVPISTYTHALYAVVNFNITAAQRNAVSAATARCEGIQYGWYQYPFLALDAFHLHISGGSSERMICSTMATMVQMEGGLWPDRQPLGISPAHLARIVGAIPPAT